MFLHFGGYEYSNHVQKNFGILSSVVRIVCPQNGQKLNGCVSGISQWQKEQVMTGRNHPMDLTGSDRQEKIVGRDSARPCSQYSFGNRMVVTDLSISVMMKISVPPMS